MAGILEEEEKLVFRLKHLIPRNLALSETLKSSTAEEISFDFEWGSIAAKAWGPADGKPVLALHGWLDNAGTFDSLIPLLPKNFRVLAIDVPGHGLSSHYPQGISYQFIECLPRIRQLTTRLRWEKFTILGHSFGGAMAALYAGVYPETVDKIILIDIFRAQVTIPELIHVRLRKSADVILKSEAETKLPPKVISYEKAVDLSIKGSGGSLDRKAAEILLKRGLKSVGDGFAFRRDLRLRAAPLSFTPVEDQLVLARNTTCDVLVIKAEHGPWFEDEKDLMLQLEAFKTKSKRVEYHTVEGGHHVHLTHPERVAPIINNFLTT